MDQDRLVMAVVAYVLEEAAAQQRYLERGDVNVGVEGAPCVCADAIGYERRK